MKCFFHEKEVKWANLLNLSFPANEKARNSATEGCWHAVLPSGSGFAGNERKTEVVGSKSLEDGMKLGITG